VEHEETQQQKSIELSPQSMLQEVPDSLLTAISRRLAQRDEYVTAQKSISELVQALSHPQWEIRAAAVRRLGEFAEQAPIEPLMLALQDEHRLVRAAAVRALGRLGSRVPLEQLIIALQDREWEVREMAVLTLGELGAQVPRALLVAALQDSNTSVHEAAAFALSKHDAISATLSEAPALPISTPRRSLKHFIAHLWLVFSRQIPLVPKSVWIVPILSMFIWCIITAYSHVSSPVDIQGVTRTLALLTTISAATGAAFLYGKEYDPGFEMTLSTPTSTRVVMLSRFLLVIGFNALLTSCASAVIALMYGGGLWSIIHVWLGPMLLTGSIAITLSLMIGSWFATLATCVLEAAQAFTVTIQHDIPIVVLAHSNTWQTNPPILLLAIFFIAFAAFYMSRQPRLADF
jgi:hypothetical protein